MLLLVFAGASLLAGAASASAMPSSLAAAGAAPAEVTLVAGGCGPGFHRAIYGGCRRNFYRGYHSFRHYGRQRYFYHNF